MPYASTADLPDAPVLGAIVPRLFPKPLVEPGPSECPCGTCGLTPTSTYGFAVIRFAAEVLHTPLDEWQKFLVIHGGELIRDGAVIRPRFKRLLIIVARQNGKALDCSMDILTANRGFTTMGDLQVGDQVFHPDGKPVRVVEAHPVRHGRPCYRVTTTDGRSVVADGEHLWTVQDMRRATKRGRRGERAVRSYEWETLTTEQLLNRGLVKGARECAFRLPRQHALISPDVNLPVDPYLFGAWLGDGTSTAAALNAGDQDVAEMTGLIKATGARIVSSVRLRTCWRLGFNIGAGRHDGFESRLRRMGVWGSHAKRVPDSYLTAGTDQRLALLRGLMDTDGSISRTGQVEFCSVNRALADAVLYLARSLGWRATLKVGKASLSCRVVSDKYRVTWSPDAGDPNPFLLRRKAERVTARLTPGKGRGEVVSIRSIERVESRPVRCIKVDRPDGLFLAGRDLLATHNTYLLKVLTLFWMFVEGWPAVHGQSTTLGQAREVWDEAQKMAQACPLLAGDFGTVLRGNNNPYWLAATGSRYTIGASNRKGGRGKSIDRLIIDELREHTTWDAYNASVPAMNARPRAQGWLITNQGDERGVVLLDLRKTGASNIEALDAGQPEIDEELALFEWSSPPGADPLDLVALAAANPNLNRVPHGPTSRSLLGQARAAVERGGEALTGFKTEIMCLFVPALDAAIDPEGWARGEVFGTLEGLRGRLAMVPEISPDMMHASLSVAAVVDGGKVRVETIASWSGPDAPRQLRQELPVWVRKVRPRKVGWLPNGPMAALAAEMDGDPRSVFRRFGPGVQVEEIRGEVSAICMGLAELVKAGDVLHSQGPDSLLSKQVLGSSKLWLGDTWRFSRKEGYCDAAYGIAGAAHLARSIPPPSAARLVVAK